MIRYLIKNNLKLMLRGKLAIAAMIAGPVLVIAVLSSAFHDLMQSYEGVEEFKAGYRVEEGSFLENNMEAIKEAGEEAGITLLEYPEGEPKELVENNDLAGFVEIGKDVYTIYESADYPVEGVTLEYFLSRCVKEGTKQAQKAVISNMESEELTLPKTEIDYMPSVDSIDYYGIIEIVYFSWMSIICAAGVLTSEKKNRIEQKYQITGISGMKLFLGKWIPVVLATAFAIGICVAVTIVLFDIHWGNPVMSAALMFLLIMASASFGLMLYAFFKNIAVTVVVLFTSVWFMGFFGGSFETYMFSSTPDALKNASPIYHVNRALVEYSCMGHSSYTNSSIFYLLAIILICSVLAVAADGIRKRGRA